jgi:predicted RNase H-like HicB family nuclease
MNLSIRIEIFKEGDVFVALSPDLNVSSFGDTVEEAKESIQEAIEAFLEECHEMGTLNEILQEFRSLKTSEYLNLRGWFSKKDWERWDEKIKRDSEEGRLDFLIEEALQEKRKVKKYTGQNISKK